MIFLNRPETMLGRDRTKDEQLTPSAPHSPAKSFSSASTTFGSPGSERLSVKAGYNDSMVMLRVPWDITYNDLRQRLYNKFVGQEGVPMSDSFIITYLQPIRTNNPDSGNPSEGLTFEPHQKHLVTSQSDWENVTTSIEGLKLTLRITDKILSPE